MLSLMIIAASLILYFATGKKRRRSVILYIFSRICDSFYLSRMLMAAVGIFACFYLPYSYHEQVGPVYVSDTIYEMEEYLISEVYGAEYRLDENLDRIKIMVNEEEWRESTLECQQDAVVAAAQCEARYLGIPFELNITFSDDMEYIKKGYYNHSKHLVCINNDLLRRDGGFNTLIAVLHEIRHSYQWAMCDAYVKLSPEERSMYCFRGVDKWCENINNYVDGDEDYTEYFDQILETDCRNYSNREAYVYLNEIKALMDEEG